MLHGMSNEIDKHLKEYVKKANLTETSHTPQAPCTPRLPTKTILFCVLTRAQRNASALQPTALAFVPYGFVSFRVRGVYETI